jgi:hypothetical protein
VSECRAVVRALREGVSRCRAELLRLRQRVRALGADARGHRHDRSRLGVGCVEGKRRSPRTPSERPRSPRGCPRTPRRRLGTRCGDFTGVSGSPTESGRSRIADGEGPSEGGASLEESSESGSPPPSRRRKPRARGTRAVHERRVFASNASHDFHLCYVDHDDVRGILKYLLSRTSTSLYLNMFGYDDEELNAEYVRCARTPVRSLPNQPL